MKQALPILFVFAALSAPAEKQPFSRYQTIIDRMMFGSLPEGFDPNKLPSEVQKSSASEKELSKEQEQLKSAVHFSVINVTADGKTVVGFTDNTDPKMPLHYFLKVGESRDGWTVKEADAETATMTVAKGEIEVTLSLGGNSAKDGGTTRVGGATPVPAAAPGGVRPPGLGSLRARRLLRQQEAKAAAAKQQEEQAAREAERQAQAEQEKQQRDAERAEQRQQLLAIKEELKRVREAKAAEATKNNDSESGNANHDTE